MTQPQTFEPDGRAIPFVDEGAGPAIVLLPAAGLAPDYLGTLASVLVEEDFRVLRVGSRRSGADAVTLDDLAQDVVDVMDHVDLGDAWLGGHAFGGAVARAVAAAHHDRVDGILLLAVDDGTDADADVEAALQTVLSDVPTDDVLDAVRLLAGPGADASAAWNILSRSLDLDALAAQTAARAAAGPWGTVPAGVPVLVVQGPADTVAPADRGSALKEAAPHQVSVVEVAGGGHLFPLTHPGETSWVIEDYLDWD